MNDFLGEFLGTAVLIVLGDGVVAGVLLHKSKAQNAGWIAITTGWAFAVMAGLFTAKAFGGPGYINPVGPFADALTGKLAPDAAARLAAAEFLGAFVGAVLVYLHYRPHWAGTPDPAVKLGVFCNAPAIRSPLDNLFCEVLATFVLVLVGGALVSTDAGLAAPLGGAVVWGIGLGLGGPTGYAINPARDLAPRVAHFLLPIPGKGPSDWGYAWIPVVGPLLGGGAAALLVKAIKG